MYPTICTELAADHFGVGLTYIDPHLTKISAGNDFHIFVPGDLELRPLDLKFDPLVILVQCYAFTNLEVCAAFLLRGNRRHGADRQIG